MLVEINNKKYAINFTHNEVNSLLDKEAHQTERRFTKCIITVDGEFMGSGFVKCYYKDVFNKEIGRQKSLSIALEDAGLDKSDRGTIWALYRNWGTKRF